MPSDIPAALQADVLETLTRRLVAIPSITQRKAEDGDWSENHLAAALEKIAAEAGMVTEAIPLADGRRGMAIYLPGKLKETIVISGHFDTVGVSDYGEWNPFDPQALAKEHPDDHYLRGRGSLDMKSGVVIGLQLMIALKDKMLSRGLIFLAVPDEENASAGILAAGEYLAQLQQKEGLKYNVNLNLDYTTDEGDDPRVRPVYGGVIGKMLPNFFVVGRDTHVSEPFNGISSAWVAAEIVRRLEANPAYGDQSKDGRRRTPPPTILRMRELKAHYNVQTPLETHIYVNYLTYYKTPAEVLRELTVVAEEALQEVTSLYEQRYRDWQRDEKATPPALRQGTVLNYAELIEEAKLADPLVESKLVSIEQAMGDADPREIALAKVRHLSTHLHVRTPFVVCYFAAPYYPSASLRSDKLRELIERCLGTCAAETGVKYVYRDYYPYISDMSFLSMDPQVYAAYPEFLRNTPFLPAESQFDPERIRQISMPVVNIGPFGYDAHQRSERVDRHYTFGELPRLLWRLLAELDEAAL